MSWPPLILQIAKDVKAIDDTVRLDLWLLSAAIHGWNSHDDEGCQARRHSALRFGLMTHVQQLNDFYQNIPMLCLDGTQELIKDAWELLRCGNSKQLDPWSTCHLCAILAVHRALAEEMVLGKYGPMVLYGYHRFKFAGLPFANSQLIVTLQRRLYPQGVPQKQQDFNTWFTKLNSAKNFDRRFQAIRAQVPLGVLLQGEDYRTSGLVKRLRKAKSPIAEEQDLLKLLDKFQQVLTTENETMYLLDGQGAKALKEKADIGWLDPDTLQRIEDDEGLKWRSIK